MVFKLKALDKNKSTEIDPLEALLDEIPEQSIRKETNIIEEEMNPWDYIRVVNVRGEPEYQATADEKVIIGHRDNPILGNKNRKEANTIKERERVIKESKEDLDNDLAVQGPIWHALQDIAIDIVDNKQKVAICCWCAPARCHCDAYVPVVVDMVKEILNYRKSNSSKLKIKCK